MNLGFILGLGARRVVGVPIDPAVLFADDEVGGWYDPSDLSTLFQDSAGTTPVTAAGQPVGLMLDKSGNGNHVSQATAGSRPTLEEDSNGKLHLLFDGTNDFLSRTAIDFTSTDEVTVIAGVRKLSDALAGSVVELGNSVAPGIFRLRAPATNNQDSYHFAVGGTAIRVPTLTGYPAPDTSIIAGISDISAQFAQLHVGNVIQAAGNPDQGTGNFGNLIFTLGRRNGTADPFNGHIYGVIARGKLTSGAQLVGLKAYMAAQSGVTL